MATQSNPSARKAAKSWYVVNVAGVCIVAEKGLGDRGECPSHPAQSMFIYLTLAPAARASLFQSATVAVDDSLYRREAMFQPVCQATRRSDPGVGAVPRCTALQHTHQARNPEALRRLRGRIIILPAIRCAELLTKLLTIPSL